MSLIFLTRIQKFIYNTYLAFVSAYNIFGKISLMQVHIWQYTTNQGLIALRPLIVNLCSILSCAHL